MRIENQNTPVRPQAAEAAEAKPITGAGAAAASGAAVPEAALAAGLSIMGALRNFMPAANTPDFEVRLAEIAAKMKETQGQAETDRVVTDQEIKKQNLRENQVKIEEAQRKMDEAAAKRDSGGIFGKIAAALQLVGGAALIAIGLAAAVIGGVFSGGMAAFAGVAIMGAGALMMLGGIDGMVSEFNDGKGIIASVADVVAGMFGEELSDDWIMGLNIASAVVMVLASLALAAVTLGVAGAGAIVAIKSGLASLGIAIGNGVASGAKAVSTAANLASGLVQAAISIAGAGVQIAENVNKLEVADLEHEAANKHADAAELQAMMAALDDLIDQALQMMMASSDRFNGMIDEAIAMMKDTGDVMSTQRFAV
ncbi:hypothetical protein ACG74X_16350 [Marivita sp. S0852]|uniref:hypothetical protein n=1 Tax=Marivita sp. S0852 TaxID=3373893 RepID=UPI0039828638